MYSACRGQQYELLEWLEKVTFPMEKRFKSLDFATRTYKIVVRRTIDLGVCPLFSNCPERIIDWQTDNDVLLLWFAAPRRYQEARTYRS